MATPIDVVVFKMSQKFVWREIGEIVRYLVDKKKQKNRQTPLKTPPRDYRG